MHHHETVLISGTQVREFLTPTECISAVEEVFRLHALGKIGNPSILGVHAVDGGFHIKAGIASRCFTF